MRPRTGSIDVMPDGRHRVRLTVNGKRSTYGIYETEEEAQRERAFALKGLESTPDDGSVPLGEWMESWLTKRELGKDIRHPETDWSRYNTHVANDPLAKITIRSVRPRDIDDFMDRVRARVAWQTAKNVKQLVNGAFKAAIRREIVKTNPVAGYVMPPQARTREPWTFASLAEQDALVSGVAGPESAIVEFAIGSGVRAGELCSLRLADVHVDGEHPHIVVRYGGIPAEPTKGKRIREVPLFGLGLSGMRRWIETLSAFAPENPHRAVFPAARGEYRDPNHVLRWETWSKAKKAAGITRRFRWHDLRHTCASSLVSGWWGRVWTLLEVKEMLGHTAIATTERYAHLAETALKKAARETVTVGKNPGALQLRATTHEHQDSSGPRTNVREDEGKAFAVAVVETLPPESVGQFTAVSAAFAAAVEAGDRKSATARALDIAAIVLASPVVRLAQAIQDGGALRLMHAAELSDAVADVLRRHVADGKAVAK